METRLGELSLRGRQLLALPYYIRYILCISCHTMYFVMPYSIFSPLETVTASLYTRQNVIRHPVVKLSRLVHGKKYTVCITDFLSEIRQKTLLVVGIERFVLRIPIQSIVLGYLN